MPLWTNDTLKRIRNEVETITGISLPFPVTADEGPGLTVKLTPEGAAVTAESLPALYRGHFLLCQAVREGKTEMETHQERHFRDCGAMLDMSRNGEIGRAHV